MADFSGSKTSNFTIGNGDTIGGASNLTISNSAVGTVTAGASVQIYSTRTITIGSTTAGTFNCVGTYANKITMSPQAVNTAPGTWTLNANNSTLNVQYTKLISVPSIAANNVTGATIAVDYVWFLGCGLGWAPNSYTGTHTWTNVYFDRSSTNIALGSATSTINLTNGWFRNSYTLVNGSTITKGVVDVRGIPNAACLSNSGACTFTNCYVTGSAGVSTQNASTITATGLVAYRCGNTGVMSQTASATVNVSYSDVIGGNTYAFRTNNASATLSVDNCHWYGNTQRPDSEINSTSQWVKTSGTFADPTNSKATPNKPLTVANIVVGTPTANQVAITFDSAEGFAGEGYRLDGIGFVRYGTTSGVYDMSSPYPVDENQMALCWIGLDTSFTWRTTGHSVTVKNLKENTTYYMQPCFIDPFGRIAYGAEQTVVTPTSGITITNQTCDDFTADYTQTITISCTATADDVVATCNDKSIGLVNTSGTSWSVSTYAGFFGASINAPIYFTARTDAGGLGTATSSSNLQVGAISAKTATLLAQMTASLSSLSAVCTLVKETSATTVTPIKSKIRVAVATYSVTTVDSIRTLVTSSYSGWANVSAVKEVDAPNDEGAYSVVYFVVTHT